ncbi:aspartyl protease family protein [Paenibacillus thalictri]|nr:aspartyl protease family protein [Paenibacillus thalictri]
MNLEYIEGLLFSSITIVHRGNSIMITHVVIDTGAAESVISIDAAGTLFNSYEPEDQLRFMVGIGGREASIRRKIDRVLFDTFSISDFHIDFGKIGEYPGINGLIGLDILIPGRFMIDLSRLQLYSVDKNNP